MQAVKGRRAWRSVVVLVVVLLAAAACRPLPGHGGRVPPTAECRGLGVLTGCSQVRFSWMPGYDDPATPNELDRVGVLKVGSDLARNVLVLNPGTSAGAGYFLPLAQDIVRETRGRWQVWSVERRENQLEDQSVLDRYKQRKATSKELFDYYLGWLADPSVANHFQLIPDASVAYARGWGMNVEVEDLHRVVEAAKARGRTVVLGGHSLGGSITTAYATWDFGGRPGGADLAGLVFIDGGSRPTPITPDAATQALQALQAGSPWLAFGGIGAPYLGLYSATGSAAAAIDPDGPSLGQTFPLLPPNLKAPVPATNAGQYGYAVDTKTSPPNLVAAQTHVGQLAATGDPRGWDSTGALTPLSRFAAMFAGIGLTGIDGTAWYQPQRLTLDAGAVAAGNANPAQTLLDVRAVHGHDLDPTTLLYAFGTSLGGQSVLDAAQVLATQSGIPAQNLTLVDRAATYAHNDPSSASPTNDFLANLLPFLTRASMPGPHAGH
jgi:hypothetical protein